MNVNYRLGRIELLVIEKDAHFSQYFLQIKGATCHSQEDIRI